MQQDRYIAAVDLGSTKIAMTVAKVTGENVQIIYYKETPSDGVNDSNVFNPLRASKPVSAALKEAENELGIKILQVVVGLPRYAVHQETASATLQRVDPNTCISQEEIDALKSIALETYPLDDASKEEIYGAVAQSFNADDLIQQPERDVVGSVADTLEGNFRIFVGSKKSVKNIEIVLNSLGVAPAKKIFMPHATANAVLTDEERDNGVALIEVGGGVTSLTIYQGRILRFYGAIPFGGESYENLSPLLERVPTLFLSENMAGFPVDSVSVDNARGTYLGTDYLYELGHRRILYLGRRRKSVAHEQRARGYLNACATHGLVPEFLDSAYSRSSVETGYLLAREYFAKPLAHSAIYCATDSLAIGVMKAADEAGIRIPEDLSLIGFDNISFTSLPRLDLTTVDQPKERMAAAAVDRLLEKIADPDSPFVHHILEPTLVERSSCRRVEEE